jgi:hypothetical protein
VIQDAVYNTLVFDATVRRLDDYPDSATAPVTDLDVYVEHTFQSLSPGHCGVMLSR